MQYNSLFSFWSPKKRSFTLSPKGVLTEKSVNFGQPRPFSFLTVGMGCDLSDVATCEWSLSVTCD